MSSFSAIIVSYNSAEVLDACLRSLGSTPAIVVDNASADDSVRVAGAYPNVQVIANTENRGFAAAVNQGVCASEAEAFLLLNPDTELLPGTLEALQSLPHRLAGGRLVDREGHDQAGFGIRRFPTASTFVLETLGINRLWASNPVNARYRYFDLDLNKPGEVEQPAGAFLFFRREVWKRVGGFDEDFQPIWFEDVDFCLRANQMGVSAFYDPALVARHFGGHSIRPLTASCRAGYWYVSLLRYASKHFRPGAFRGVSMAVALGAVPRLILDSIRQRSLKPVAAYSKIIRLAILSLFSPELARPALALGEAGRIRG